MDNFNFEEVADTEWIRAGFSSHSNGRFIGAKIHVGDKQ
jgi:hypothetical protein